MSTSVIGIKPPDAKWKKMKAARDACLAVGATLPTEIRDFFEDGKPDELGVVVRQRDLGDAVREWKEDMASGYEVDLTKLPKDVTILRFSNRW
jgi:hypothetical protein